MSTTGIESVLNRAMSDSAFADQLFANPEQALTGFELTAEETATFKSMARADFDAMLKVSPEERKSFVVIIDRHDGGFNHNQTTLHI